MNFEQRKQQIFSRITAEQIVTQYATEFDAHIRRGVFSSRTISTKTAQKRLNELTAAQRDDVIAQFAMKNRI